MLKLARPLRWLMPLALLAGISGGTRANGAAEGRGKDRSRDLRGRLLLVRGGGLREGAGRDPAVSGYTGGTVANPSYEQVTTQEHRPRRGGAGHLRPGQGQLSAARRLVLAQHRSRRCGRPVLRQGHPVSQRNLLSGRCAEEDRRRAPSRRCEASGRFKQPIVTEITAAGPFYPAEDYHQDYYKKNANRYQYYKHGCGRVQRLEQIWGKATPPPNLTQ